MHAQEAIYQKEGIYQKLDPKIAVNLIGHYGCCWIDPHIAIAECNSLGSPLGAEASF